MRELEQISKKKNLKILLIFKFNEKNTSNCQTFILKTINKKFSQENPSSCLHVFKKKKRIILINFYYLIKIKKKIKK